jgi:hypothetical protein
VAVEVEDKAVVVEDGEGTYGGSAGAGACTWPGSSAQESTKRASGARNPAATSAARLASDAATRARSESSTGSSRAGTPATAPPPSARSSTCPARSRLTALSARARVPRWRRGPSLALSAASLA